MSKMLVVVDYQNDFVDGALGFPGAEKLDQPIAEKVREYAQNGDVIIALRDTHYDDYLETREGKTLPVVHAIFGSEGWNIYGETGKALLSCASEAKVLFLDKTTFGLSPQTMCDFVTKLDVDEIELVGLVTNMCLISNVCCFQAAFPNAQLTVPAGLVASFDPDLHTKALDVLRGLQVRVV